MNPKKPGNVWMCLFKPLQGHTGYSIKKRNVSPLLLSAECRPHCFPNNQTKSVGFIFFIFASFPLEILPVQTIVTLTYSCQERGHRYHSGSHKEGKSLLGLETNEWTWNDINLCHCQIHFPPEGAVVCESIIIYFFSLWWVIKEKSKWKLPRESAFMFWEIKRNKKNITWSVCPTVKSYVTTIPKQFTGMIRPRKAFTCCSR